MARNLKMFGLGLLAAFAMSAVAASAAHATNAAVKCGNDNTKECTLKVTHDPNAPSGVFKTKVGNVECAEFQATSTVKDGTKLTELTLTELEVSECELGGLFATDSISSGCHATLSAGETIVGGAAGAISITETGGTTCEIKITAGACTVTIKPQNNLKTVTYTNVKTGTKEEITAHANIEKIKYTVSASCPGGAGTFEDGKYEDTITDRGFNKANESEQTDLTIEDN